MLQVSHESCLIDCLDWSQAHGNCWELPEVGHQPGMRIGGQSLTVNFLPEPFDLRFGDATFQKSSRIDSGCRVTLKEDEIPTMLFSGCTPEVVETHIV